MGSAQGVCSGWSLLMGRSIPVSKELKFGCCKSDLFPVRVGLHHGCPLSVALFITFMDRICSRGVEGGKFGGQRTLSLLFADDVVHLASSNSDQLMLGRFSAECKADANQHLQV